MTTPLLSVASASACGLTDIMDLSWIFFTSLFMHLFILCIEFHNHKKAIQSIAHDSADLQASAVLLISAWLCAIAYLIEQIALLQRAGSMQQRPWAIAAGSLILLYQMFYMGIVTVSRFGLLSSVHSVVLLDGLGLVQKYTVSLSIMGGAVSILEP